MKAYEITEERRTARGTELVNQLQLAAGEKIKAVITLRCICQLIVNPLILVRMVSYTLPLFRHLYFNFVKLFLHVLLIIFHDVPDTNTTGQ